VGQPEEEAMLVRHAEREADLAIVSLLVEVSNVDTVYRDVYLGRAGALLTPTLSAEGFHRLEQQQVELAALTTPLGRALEKANWPVVRDLSQRAAGLKKTAEEMKKVFEIGRGVYAAADVQLDPFSPGLQQLTRVPATDLPALRMRVTEQLTVLTQADASWKDFYTARRAAIKSRAGRAAEQASVAGGASTADAREAAALALKAGDMERLARLADDAIAGATPEPSAAASDAPAGVTRTPEPAAHDLLVAYSSETLARARGLGLAHRRLESRVQMTSLRPYAWTPLTDEIGHVDIKSLPLPAGFSGGLPDLVELLMIHPLVNSGGARFLPTLVAEDMLVEDFPDPAEGEPAPASPLLTALELPGRRGLSRVAIEHALRAQGSRVVELELGLDPRVFRLVCIPPDAYVRLGEGEGWGRQPFWTHFDGYFVMANGRLRALAGGDARFGGLYDLLGVGRDYDSDRLLARFAVVQRERMAAW
jgi:hypothetical protein